MSIYYGKMIEHVMRHPDREDPMEAFSKIYTIRDCVFDIGRAWDTIEVPLIHKCFEELLDPEAYVTEYKKSHNATVQWAGINFRGFTGPDDDLDPTDAAEKARKMKMLVQELNNKQALVTLDEDDLDETIEYDPNSERDVSRVIAECFHNMRVAEGYENDDAADDDAAPTSTRRNRGDDAYKALVELRERQGLRHAPGLKISQFFFSKFLLGKTFTLK